METTTPGKGNGKTVLEAETKTIVHQSLDDLAALNFGELAARYAAGTVAPSLAALDGPLVGRMLAVRGIGNALRGWAASPRFVWEGKTFSSTSSRAGKGINRVSAGAILGRQDLFPFTTSIGPSIVDGRDAVILDYDLAVNPPYIRRIHDEVRLVAPKLWLGPAMWKRPGAPPVTVLWFALQQAR